MSILVVDDSKVSRLLLQRLLERGGFGPTIGAASAEESYAILGLTGGEARTDVELVLMDVELPGVRGYDACRRLRGEDRLRDVPVLMVTANLGPEHVQEAFNSGARDYIGKPVQEVELLARVGAALALKREMDARREREIELLVLKRQLEEANAGLQRLSTEDGLTGLANRRAFSTSITSKPTTTASGIRRATRSSSSSPARSRSACIGRRISSRVTVARSSLRCCPRRQRPVPCSSGRRCASRSSAWASCGATTSRPAPW
ncbi:MAG: response regulator [Deltaproteobacteria bacterium]|nr:MAG: response regulator [Deltaproteobacteria bacterium]